VITPALILTAVMLAAEPVVLDTDPQARQPQLAVDPKGRIMVVYGVGNEIRCRVSTDRGLSFNEPITVGSLPTLALGGRRGPRVAATGRAFIVTAIGGAQGGGKDGDVFAWCSIDQGVSWSKPIRINAEIGSAREGLHALAAHPDGTVFCTWLDLRTGAMTLFGARSTDHGATWQPDRVVYRSPEKQICTCCHPSAAFALDGTLFVMWRDDIQGARDMYLSRSSDRGDTFARAEKLGARTWIFGQCPMDGGAIAINADGTVTTIWMRAQDVFLTQPGQFEKRLAPGIQPWAAATPLGPAMTWLQSRPGPLRALLPGEYSPRLLAQVASDPVAAAANADEPLFAIAWEDGPPTGRRILVQTFDTPR
jgi:hypothetical protein